jgi:hypothetical protein
MLPCLVPGIACLKKRVQRIPRGAANGTSRARRTFAACSVPVAPDVPRASLPLASRQYEVWTYSARKPCDLLRRMAQERPSHARMPEDVLHRRPVPCPSNGSLTRPFQEFCCSRAAATPTLHATQNPDLCTKHGPRPRGAPTRFRACPCGDKVCGTIAFCVLSLQGCTRREGVMRVTPGGLASVLLASVLPRWVPVRACVFVKTRGATRSGGIRAAE